MRSIYVLSDYGVSLTILKGLYVKNISFIDIEFFGEMYLKDNKVTKKNIDLIVNAMELAKKDKYQNSIQELFLFGISNLNYRKLMKHNMTFDDLNLSKEEIYNKYLEKDNFYYELQAAYKKLKENYYNLPTISDYSKYLLMYIKNRCEKYSVFIQNIYEEIQYTSYPIEYFYSDLKELERKKAIRIINDKVEYVVPTLSKRIEKLSKRTQDIIKERIKGKTLQEIGEIYDLSRERIRQIIEKEYKKLPPVYEDKYQLYFEEYDFSENEFCKTFLESKEVYYYLIDKYQKGSKEFYEIENDYLLPKDMVIRIKRLKNEIYINNTFIVGNRDGVLKYILKKINSNIRIEKLFDLFNDTLSNEFNKYNIQGFDNIHSLEAVLDRKTWCISGLKKTYRYYETRLIDSSDIKQIKEMLLSSQGFYSSLFFFENNKELMNQLDIRNEYELHNFLKKNIYDSNIYYLRMPNIVINYSNKDDYILYLIYEHSPINIYEFCKMLRTEYGHREDTMVAYLGAKFGKYITNQLISVDVRKLTYEETELIMKNLYKTIYTIKEFEEVLNRIKINKSKELLNNLNLNTLGYRIVGAFVVQNKFNKMEDAIYKSIERGEFDKEFIKTNSSSYAFVWNLIKDKKILDIGDQYITHNLLYKFGITEDNIDDFQEKLIKHYSRDNIYFTAYNIKNNIDCLLLKNYSITENIINGLVFSLNIYKRINWKNNIIFVKTSQPGSRIRFIEDVIKNNNGKTLSEIKNILVERYNIKVDEIDIKKLLYVIEHEEKNNRYYIDEIILNNS